MKTEQQRDTEIRALSERLTVIERSLGLKTTTCAGYCGQPTANPGGMCLACQERDRRETARMNREGR